MRIIRTTDPTPKDTLGQLALYNAMDVLTLPEIFPQLQQEFTEFKQQTYAFEMQLQAALLEMQFNGVPVDIGKRAELIRSFTQRRVKTEAMLHKFCLALDYYRFYKSIAAFRYSNATGISAADLPNSWNEWLATPLGIRREWKKLDPEATADFQKSLKAYDKPFNANSPTQKLQLFYHFFGTPNNIISQVEYSDYPAPWLKTHGIPEYKARKVGGEFGPSTNRDSLEKIQKRALDSDERDAAYWAQPFISCCLAISDYTKSLGFLNSKLDQGWFRSSFGAVTETGRLASKDSHDGFGCFPPGAEALTPTGWKSLESIEANDLVMQWHPDGSMEWALAQPYETFFEGNLCEVKTEQTAFAITPSHRLACQDHQHNKQFYPSTAAKLFARKSATRVKLSGIFAGEQQVSPLVIACLADGSLERAVTTYWRFSFKKQRKYNRLVQLLKEAGIDWTERPHSKADYCPRISFNAPAHWPTAWGAWVLDLTPSCATDLLDELAFWDGSSRGKSIVFYTAEKSTANWVQTLAHLAERSSTIVESPQSKNSWSDTLMYKVNIKPRDYAVVEAQHKSLVPYKGPVFCLTVPSSYFLVRQFGKVFVTGNSNAQNITPELRIILTCPLETKIGACDYEQIESRNVAAICYELFGATAYLIATESGDLHSLACSMVWDDLPWPTDFSLKWLALHGPFPRDLVKAAKKIANQKFYRQFSRRDLSKRLGHGSNYLGKPEHMAKQTHIPVNLVRHYQDVYFEAFPEIPLWHQWTIEQVMTKQELTTILFNRTRQFFNRPTDDATIREAVAYVPQSMAADYTNKALLELHKAAVHGNLPVTIFLQKHDELGFRYAEKDESLVIPRVCDIMEQSFVLTDPEGNKREWSVPVEALVGWNLGFKSDKNPDGLTDFPDTRTRSRNPFDLGSFSL